MSAPTVAVRERPILFSGEMVRAILDGRKTQTRRVMKRQPPAWVSDIIANGDRFVSAYSNRSAIKPFEYSAHCPYGQPGDRLWVRESWRRSFGTGSDEVFYAADVSDYDRAEKGPWKPSIHMPRAVSRLTIEITGVYVQRIQDLTEGDAEREGVEHPPERWPSFGMAGGTATEARAQDAWLAKYGRDWHRRKYRELWDSLNAKRGYGWDVNPWVWALMFRRVEP
jgi:hypothetical protein